MTDRAQKRLTELLTDTASWQPAMQGVVEDFQPQESGGIICEWRLQGHPAYVRLTVGKDDFVEDVKYPGRCTVRDILSLSAPWGSKSEASPSPGKVREWLELVFGERSGVK